MKESAQSFSFLISSVPPEVTGLGYMAENESSSDLTVTRHMQLADVLCRQPKRAGVYLMGTDGEIPAHSTTYMETACSYNEPVVMHPFAYRTHAHTHGSSRSIARLAFYGRPV